MNQDIQKQLIDDLIMESTEGLERFDRELLCLEKHEGGTETMNNIFRVIHTIKGTAGCLGLGKIEKAAHVGENLLSLVREGKVTATPEMISVLLSLSDTLRGLLRTLEQTGAEGAADHSALFAKLEALQTQAPATKGAPANKSFGLFDDEPLPVVEAVAPVVAAPVVLPSPASPTVPKPAEHDSPPAAESSGKTSVADTAIRVDVGQLDKLMNLVGELVLARNQIVSNTAQFDQAALMTAAQRLNIITTELQENVMKTRMQPIGNVWARFPRIVRDVSGELGKRVRLIMEGQSTELDRTIIEAIKDPLTHIVRNSIDHGIESIDRRRAAGKPEEGLLSMRAYHEGGQVNIEIMDDGAGISVEKVKAKAVEKNLISADQSSRLSDREALLLIFLPGFSTAERITNVSGRGVGMDVVRTNIEKIGGSVDLQTDPGQGTTIKIKIPLTLAIIPALIVTSGGDRYAIPQVSLLELVRLEGEQARRGIEQLCGAPIYRLRGQLLPLAFLNREFGVGDVPDTSAGSADLIINIVVLQADGRQFGLVVDQINDTEEIVVKPLGKQLKGITCFAGATIMGDGNVALILDVLGLAQHANVVVETRERTRREEVQRGSGSAGDARQTLLLFSVGKDRRMAIPLSMAARLEEFPRSSIERAGRQDVVQYRGQILPLIDVAEHLEPGSGDSLADPVQVVVYTEHGRSAGLVVRSINDIVDETLSVQRAGGSTGVLGSAVIQDRVTDLLDVGGIIRSYDPGFEKSAA